MSTTPPHPDYRPKIHYAPAANWMNDPNGLVYFGGQYHLYYQYNPHGDTHAHMHWGKATSPDLVHWQEHEIALPQHEHEIFSGSAVVDWHNTSGFGQAEQIPLVACYTGHTPDNQSQFLAYSLDAGERWNYSAGAVLDLGKQDFRDPKVFWHERTGRWIMAVVHPDEHQVELFASPDLRRWQSLSIFGPVGATGGIWEVPELFPVQDDHNREYWVLKVDLHPGGPFGGSGVQYWLGDFDGVKFTPATAASWADYGKDFYAALSWNEVQGRRVWLAWMNNWQYARQVPTPGQRGMMSLPREVFVLHTAQGPQLAQRPVPELQQLRREQFTLTERTALEVGQAYELRLNWTTEALAEITLEFCSGAGVECTVALTPDRLAVIRPVTATTDGLEGYAGTHWAALPTTASGQFLHVFLDACSVEVFAAGGCRVVSDLLYPAQAIQEVVCLVKTFRDAEVTGEMWSLDSVR